MAIPPDPGNRTPQSLLRDRPVRAPPEVQQAQIHGSMLRPRPAEHAPREGAATMLRRAADKDVS